MYTAAAVSGTHSRWEVPRSPSALNWLEQAVPALNWEKRENSASGDGICFHEFGVTT